MAGYITKADVVTREVREGLAATACGGFTLDERGARQIKGIDCAGCGATLATELDFAEHFVIADGRFLNLGECPNTDKGRALMRRGTSNIPFYQQGPTVKARTYTETTEV